MTPECSQLFLMTGRQTTVWNGSLITTSPLQQQRTITVTLWPEESSWHQLWLQWLSENFHSSNPAVKPPPLDHSASILTPTLRCLTLRVITKRMIVVPETRTDWRNFQTESKPDLTASEEDVQATLPLCPNAPWLPECPDLSKPWTNQIWWLRRNWVKLPVEVDWSHWSRATCTRSQCLDCTGGNTWLCAVTA